MSASTSCLSMSSSSPWCTGKIGDDDDDDAPNDVQSISRLNVEKESIAVRWCVRVLTWGSVNTAGERLSR